MADWLDTCLPIDGVAIRDAAIDGSDFQTAAMAILSDPASVVLPQAVAVRLGKIAFGSCAVSTLDEKQIASVANYLDRGRNHV